MNSEKLPDLRLASLYLGFNVFALGGIDLLLGKDGQVVGHKSVTVGVVPDGGKPGWRVQ